MGLPNMMLHSEKHSLGKEAYMIGAIIARKAIAGSF
jgi:ketosteroid isomerase-like protein